MPATHASWVSLGGSQLFCEIKSQWKKNGGVIYKFAFPGRWNVISADGMYIGASERFT